MKNTKSAVGDVITIQVLVCRILCVRIYPRFWRGQTNWACPLRCTFVLNSLLLFPHGRSFDICFLLSMASEIASYESIAWKKRFPASSTLSLDCQRNSIWMFFDVFRWEEGSLSGTYFAKSLLWRWFVCRMFRPFSIQHLWSTSARPGEWLFCMKERRAVLHSRKTKNKENIVWLLIGLLYFDICDFLIISF